MLTKAFAVVAADVACSGWTAARALLWGLMGGSTPHGQHNKSHKTGKHQAKGQRHKQREAKGGGAPASCPLHHHRGAASFNLRVMRTII